jgi:hypothetical protein
MLIISIKELELDSYGLTNNFVKYWGESYDNISCRSIKSVTRKIKATLSSRQARRWITRLEFHWKEVKKGVYNDGHGREDVKKYWNNVFLPLMSSIEDRLMEWDENLQPLIKLI